MKNVGIWIDKRKAKIVSLVDENESLDIIVSDVEEFHVGGGSGARSKGVQQDVVQDNKYLQREKHQLAEFFKDISISIADADAIVIFGPAQTGEKLYNVLLDKYSHFNNKKLSVEKADNMTDNQIMAWVRNHYNSDK